MNKLNVKYFLSEYCWIGSKVTEGFLPFDFFFFFFTVADFNWHKGFNQNTEVRDSVDTVIVQCIKRSQLRKDIK